ncbi:transglutaminase-like cysteine peptidase [Roseibium sp.]|uniref:transglutaminase-like cysteine peptidase n=1 Tax=Roseibium sp. TaxID=1936156 RepID=UPI003D0CF5FD
MNQLSRHVCRKVSSQPSRRVFRLGRAVRLCLIAAGTLTGFQGASALAAAGMLKPGLANSGAAPAQIERASLATPSLPFPENGGTEGDGKQTAKRASTEPRTITLPRSLRSVGRKTVRRFKVQKPASKPLATSRRSPEGPDADRSSGSSFFGSTAIPFANIANAKDWDRVRHRKIEALEAVTCSSADCKARYAVLASYSRPDSGNSFFQKLDTVNRIVNRNIRYQEDQATYQRLDYWASPDEIARSGVGDCEDFAILKYAMLLEAGVPESSMSLVVLKDMQRNLFHAVLAVSTNKGHFILDNTVNRVYRDREIAHYRPMFSFSTDRSWIHGTPKDGKMQQVSSLEAVAPSLDRWTETGPRKAAATQDWQDLYPVERN